jgi:hypothetical protein
VWSCFVAPSGGSNGADCPASKWVIIGMVHAQTGASHLRGGAAVWHRPRFSEGHHGAARERRSLATRPHRASAASSFPPERSSDSGSSQPRPDTAPGAASRGCRTAPSRGRVGALRLLVQPVSDLGHPDARGVHFEDAPDGRRLLLVDLTNDPQARSVVLGRGHVDVVVAVDLPPSDV